MLDLNTLLTCLTLGEKISEYMGFTRSLGVEIHELKESNLAAGFMLLRDAEKAKDSNRLLSDARLCFTKAISLERDERALVSYIGLALCYSSLGDMENYLSALERASLVKLGDQGLLRRWFNKDEIEKRKIRLFHVTNNIRDAINAEIDRQEESIKAEIERLQLKLEETIKRRPKVEVFYQSAISRGKKQELRNQKPILSTPDEIYKYKKGVFLKQLSIIRSIDNKLEKEFHHFDENAVKKEIDSIGNLYNSYHELQNFVQ